MEFHHYLRHYHRQPSYFSGTTAGCAPNALNADSVANGANSLRQLPPLRIPVVLRVKLVLQGRHRARSRPRGSPTLNLPAIQPVPERDGAARDGRGHPFRPQTSKHRYGMLWSIHMHSDVVEGLNLTTKAEPLCQLFDICSISSASKVPLPLLPLSWQ